MYQYILLIKWDLKKLYTLVSAIGHPEKTSTGRQRLVKRISWKQISTTLDLQKRNDAGK
jgi:hypothetical protein